MILEVLTYMLTPSNSLSRKYGFLYSSVSLEKRFQRCKKIWQPHLENCKTFFLEATQKLPRRNHVVILGSAHLHELPLEMLLTTFDNVSLVDIQHPLTHLLKSLWNRKINLISMDLSRSLNSLDSIENLNDLSKLMSQISKEPLFHFEADLIVSANILSQLGLEPIKALERKLNRDLTIPEKDMICTSYAEMHLKSLIQCKGKKIIYSDREVFYHDPSGKEIYRGSYPVNFDGFNRKKEWEWMLAPLNEASKDYSIQMKIQAYEAE